MRATTNGHTLSGFTLLEIIIAMSILSVALLGIVKMQMQSAGANNNARNLSAATNLCRGKIEDLRRLRAYYVANSTAPVQVAPDLVDPEAGAVNDLGNWADPDQGDGGTLNESGKGGGIFTRAWNVVDNLPGMGIKTVRVRVSWMQGSTERGVELETQISLKNLSFY